MPYVIAEIGVNHDGSLLKAHRLIEAAHMAGADAVKFQTFTASEVASAEAPLARYQRKHGADNQRSMLEHYEFDARDWQELARAVRDLGLDFMSTAFGPRSLDLVESLAPVAHKIPSGEITNHRFLADIAALGRAVIISTGMSTEFEVAEALKVFPADAQVCLLHCVTAYPAPLVSCNLNAIPYMRARFGRPVGWSDHTAEHVAVSMAIALGAPVLERHLTEDRSSAGPDHAASDTPSMFAEYVNIARASAAAMGTLGKSRSGSEVENMAVARRSWYATRDLEVGVPLASEDLVALRPALGIPVSRDLRGVVVARRVSAGSCITAEDIAKLEESDG